MSGNKTLHTVSVLDGIGDLIHFCDWFAAYCQINDINDTAVVIDYAVYTTKEQREKELKDYINNLPDGHPLKAKKDIIFTAYDNDVTDPGSFIDVFKRDTYRASYAISQEPAGLEGLCREQNLPFCFIHELGQHMSIYSDDADSENIHHFTFGFLGDDICGCFFPDLGSPRELRDIVSEMSDFLQEKLFGEDYKRYSVEQKTKIIENMDLIVGYYQLGRSTDPIDELMQQSIVKGRKPFLFLTGKNYENITAEQYRRSPFDSLNAYSEFNQVMKIEKCIHKYVGNNKYGFASAKLEDADYKDLFDLLRVNSNNKYFCSGDNTLLTSISLGKLPIFLHQQSPRKVGVLIEFNNYLKQLLSNAKDNVNFSSSEIQYLEDIINAFTTSGYLKPINDKALDFFAKKIAPHIIKQSYLSKERMQGIISLVEGDKLQQDESPKTHKP